MRRERPGGTEVVPPQLRERRDDERPLVAAAVEVAARHVVAVPVEAQRRVAVHVVRRPGREHGTRSFGIVHVLR